MKYLVMSNLSKMQYSPIDPERESHEGLLSGQHDLKQVDESTKKWRQRLFTALLIAGVGVACLTSGLVGYRWHRDMDGPCTQHISNSLPAPLVHNVTYHTKPFNGSFIKENIYRQGASPEVDAAWESLGVNYRAVRVSPEDARKAGISHDHVKINQKYGGGFPVNVEGLHHLHCLNLLRKALYYNYDYYRDLGEGAFKNDGYIVKRHVCKQPPLFVSSNCEKRKDAKESAHCLDILRQQLMCTVDVGIFGQVWLFPEHPEPFVDFNTQHRCRNYEDIQQWTKQNQLPADVPPDFLEPPKAGDRVYTETP